ncbi:XF1762 family protein [Sphaerimonospora sp. CA-214678]|uniref:XF1762 family protein n=1 Tax=Sphaerimonospora sp. CA-214678 TaxID=3240029 RepID=UPI003D8ED57E
MESRNENQTIANEREVLNSPKRPENRRLVISPVAIQTARAFIAWTQPAFTPPADAAFAIGARTGDGTLLGVALIGWPTASLFDDGDTAELLCLATDGMPDVSPTLLVAAWREVRTMGYRRLIAYTRIYEPGTGLWDAGFRIVPSPLGRGVGSRSGSPEDGDAVRVLWEIRDAGGRR